MVAVNHKVDASQIVPHFSICLALNGAMIACSIAFSRTLKIISDLLNTCLSRIFVWSLLHQRKNVTLPPCFQIVGSIVCLPFGRDTGHAVVALPLCGWKRNQSKLIDCSEEIRAGGRKERCHKESAALGDTS